MAATTPTTVTVLHRCSVASASDAADQRLPLTYFDMFWLYFHPIQRLFFYRHPCSAANFMEIIVPQLTNSLSQTLSHYLPLAGSLLYPLESGKPELGYFSGDSVAVTFAESSETANYFDYLTGDQPREAEQFHRFVPELPESRIDSESGFRKFPLLAVQVTHFPEIGVAIGVTNHHIAGDASSIVGFLKAWSSTTRLGGVGEDLALPFYDRSAIRDPTGRVDIYWNQMKEFKIGDSQPHTPTDKVRATFVLQKTDLEKLKSLVKERVPDSIHLSSFTVTIAYFWSCIDKAEAAAGEEIADDTAEYYGFSVDVRGRVEPPVPASYFGNCLGFAVAESTHGEIKGEDGFFVAAKLVGELIRDKVNKKGELLSDADDWLVKYGPLMGKRCFGVAGSPKFDVYGVDFGWGKPTKHEAVSIDDDPNPSISLCKSREFEGGLEMSVSFPKKTMDAFAAVFYNGLKN